MASEKKTEVLTIRLSQTTKKTIEEEAAKREWTPSKLAEKILTTWTETLDKNSIEITFLKNNISNIQIN